MSPLLNYIISSFAIGITFLYGCTGEILTEKAGHLNLGIPGIMCMGGACGCSVIPLFYNTGTPGFIIVIVAILAAFLGGAAMGGIYCLLTVTLKSNQNVTGLAMTIFGAGLTKFILSAKAGTAHEYLFALKHFRFPFYGIKGIGAFLYCGVMFFLAIIIALISSYVLSRTRVGLHLRAVGENPATSDAVGINVTKYKYVATVLGSGIAALGGLYYIMDYAGSYEAYKTIEPLGWLAVALVIFTLWKPHISIIGSLVFGLLFLAGTSIPTLLDSVPLFQKKEIARLMETLPYVVTVIVLIITSVKKKRENQPPASLGLPYFREER